jgi:hypothetical protein
MASHHQGQRLGQVLISRETGKVPFVQINFGGYRVYRDLGIASGFATTPDATGAFIDTNSTDELIRALPSCPRSAS